MTGLMMYCYGNISTFWTCAINIICISIHCVFWCMILLYILFILSVLTYMYTALLFSYSNTALQI